MKHRKKVLRGEQLVGNKAYQKRRKYCSERRSACGKANLLAGKVQLLAQPGS
jgi:hypothetical protein